MMISDQVGSLFKLTYLYYIIQIISFFAESELLFRISKAEIEKNPVFANDSQKQGFYFISSSVF
jgi:hypothetical protein